MIASRATIWLYVRWNRIAGSNRARTTFADEFILYFLAKLEKLTRYEKDGKIS